MINIVQKTEKRTDWSLTPEEILKGFNALQDAKSTYCAPIGGGMEYYIVPNDPTKATMYIAFNALEVCTSYAEINGVDWPLEVRREITDKEYHAMFLEVRDYIEYEYRNEYNDQKIFTVHPQKKVPL